MIVATIFEKETKVRLHYYDYSTRIDHTITVSYGSRISITLSEDEDKWLITVYSKDGITTCSIFADCIEKGNY